MKTRQDELLPYRELARRRAAISRQLVDASLPRWSALTGEGWEVQADLRFSLDEEGVAWVHGEFSARAKLRCQRCLDVLDSGFSGSLALCLVADDAQAAELAQHSDVLVVAGDEVAVSDIVEDELLLGIPEQLCVAEPCERRPALSYPAADAPAEESASPFAVLGRLKSK